MIGVTQGCARFAHRPRQRCPPVHGDAANPIHGILRRRGSKAEEIGPASKPRTLPRDAGVGERERFAGLVSGCN